MDELYSCPGCGAVSQISVLQSGCPFCKTFFSMNELFPKVTNYYFLQDDSLTDKEFKNTMRKVLLPCIVFSVERIQCKSCGAGFNAAKMRKCPHCGTRYEMGDDDWIITKITA